MKKFPVFVLLSYALAGFHASVYSNPTIIPSDLIVEGRTELQDDAEVQGDLKIIGQEAEILLGSDGLFALQSFYYPGKSGVFWDPQQMAFRVGRSTGTEWSVPWGLYSVGLGYNVRPTGTHSVALNQSTTAGGGSSLATGKNTMAGGDASVSMGFATQAQSFASVALGSYNELLGGSHDTWIPSDTLFVIGSGTAWNNRRNAVTVLKNGNVGIGISAPEERLAIEGDARITGKLFVGGDIIGDVALQDGLRVEGGIAGGGGVATGVYSFAIGPHFDPLEDPHTPSGAVASGDHSIAAGEIAHAEGRKYVRS